MTPRNKLGCMPNSLSAAKYLKMATPTFFGHATGKIAVSPKSVELPALLDAQNVQNGQVLGVIIEFKVLNSIFCHIVAN